MTSAGFNIHDRHDSAEQAQYSPLVTTLRVGSFIPTQLLLFLLSDIIVWTGGIMYGVKGDLTLSKQQSLERTLEFWAGLSGVGSDLFEGRHISGSSPSLKW